jgi:glycerophosphoryl diester phosphodiesterase
MRLGSPVLALTLLASPALWSCSSTDAAHVDAGPPERRCMQGENIQACGKNLVIAHRGGGLLAPEETLVAFENAVGLGVDVLELDVHATSDGVVVCMHDAEVNRTTDGTGEIRNMTLAEVKQLDAGYEFTPDDGKTFPYRGKGVEVATLEEVLTAFPTATFSIEIKQVDPPIADEVLGVIEAAGMFDRVLVASFDDDTLIALRNQRPNLLTSYAAGEIVEFTVLTPEDVGYEPPAPVLQAPMGLADEDHLALARNFGVRVHVWTINDAADMETLLERGAHGIMSDDPALLIKVVDDLGLAADKGFAQ